MRQATLLLVMLPLVLGLVSCAVLGVEGSGNVTTESREVGDFDEIVLSGTGRVMIQVTGNESLTIEAEDNILPPARDRGR